MSNTKNPLFKDPEVQDRFDQDGFVTLRVLEQEQVDELIQLYQQSSIKDEAGYGFFISMDNKDQALANKIMDRIYEIVLPKTDQHFQNAKAFTSSFVIKDPNPKGVVPIHQDWTFVDNEGKFTSVTCWIALVETTMENGALGAIKGSHNFLPAVRPSPSPQVVSPLRDLMFSLFPYVQLLPLQPGEAMIFDNRTFHASPPNTTDKPRLAVGLGFTQKEAQLVHYYLKSDGTESKMLKYAIEKDFFKTYNNARLSNMYNKGQQIEGYTLLEEVAYSATTPDKADLLEKVKAAGNAINGELIERLAELFSYNLDGTKKTSESANGQQETIESDNKPFWKVYTPYNIYREIKYRLTGR
ncbi:MAG: phytanoyl-CoA dioxygenase family protein [Bacteroidota bacterium]